MFLFFVDIIYLFFNLFYGYIVFILFSMNRFKSWEMIKLMNIVN